MEIKCFVIFKILRPEEELEVSYEDTKDVDLKELLSDFIWLSFMMRLEMSRFTEDRDYALYFSLT